MPPEFDYDPLKSFSNWVKHGVWLADAAELWKDRRKLLTRGKTKDGEIRFCAYGLYQSKIWKAVFVLRAGKYRLITFHRATRRESDAYNRR